MTEKIKKYKNKIIVISILAFVGMMTVSAITLIHSTEVSYSNTNSGLTADNVQDAIDELYEVAQLSQRIDALESKINNYWKTVYPVGSIYFSIEDNTAAKVQSRFGGTWVAFGSGRTLVGVNTNDTDYNTVSKTGGAKTHSITVGNLPAHNHPIPALGGSTAAKDNVGQARSSGAHTHRIVGGTNGSTHLMSSKGNYSSTYSDGSKWGPWFGGGYDASDNVYAASAGAHTHTLNIPSLSVSTNASNTNGCTNCSGTALDTKDPYITVYMWKRTA